MKKFLALLLAVCMVITVFAACSKEEETVEETKATEAPVVTEEPTEAPTEAPTEEPTEAPTEEPKVQNTEDLPVVNYEIPKAGSAITIDGELEAAWDNALTIELNHKTTKDVLATGLICQGATVKYLWADDGLYVYVKANDTSAAGSMTPVGNCGSYNCGDGFQICLYFGSSQYFFSLTPKADDGKAYVGEHFVFSDGSTGANVPGAEISAKADDAGYVMEIKLPTSVFGENLSIAAGTSFNMTNVVMDADGTSNALFIDSGWFNASLSNVYTFKG